jgi:5-methylcytosine-specific restriction endonuclease McrA
VPNPIRKYLFEEAKYKCTECGWCKKNPSTGKVPLTIDHIDGNSSNHKRENLKVLCPNCHSLTPTYGALNKGNGRKTRRR